MRIHTSLTAHEIRNAKRDSGAPVSFRTADEHGSATHARSFDIRLEGSGGKNNTGLYGAGDYSGATWDEWGAVLGAIFDADPDARMGGTAKRPIYGNADHFHFLTANRFDGRDPSANYYLPADTHPRHGWIYDGRNATNTYAVSHCRKCSAVKRETDFATFSTRIASETLGA